MTPQERKIVEQAMREARKEQPNPDRVYKLLQAALNLDNDPR